MITTTDYVVVHFEPIEFLSLVKSRKRSMSDRPKRERRAPTRYEPQEVPVDDYDDDYETGEDIAISGGSVSNGTDGAEGRDYRKRYKGEFDELDEDEEDLDEPDEYEVNDGFLVPDDYEESYEDDHPPTEDEEEEFSDEDEEDEDYDEDEGGDDDDVEPSDVDEPDVADPE